MNKTDQIPEGLPLPLLAKAELARHVSYSQMSQL
eukprot:CAMPEP_0197278406 /NCGR_PEP_ID=MMETSP1432-20130617/18600_1 /TAXON_ID=44447 /ORGANISM="Pseudo-nitzschia delicatissima, Strain UNC1205" /LENGTH=33 /DNA_ID= /DNA_START= /DNA_END= /DNA_ORIENTATION=